MNIPVVSTEVENIESSSGLVRIAASHEEFIATVASSLKNSRLKVETSQEYLALNSWRSRFASHVDELLSIK
jgi:hypothetical protein